VWRTQSNRSSMEYTLARDQTMNIRPNAPVNRLLISLVVGLVVLLIVIGLLSRAFGENDVRVAKPAPSFVLKDAQNHIVKLTDFKGKGLIVCFLATSDKNCQKQMEILNGVLKECGGTNLVVLGLSLDQAISEGAKVYMAQQPLNYSLYTADYDTVQAFGGLTAIPTMFVIDGNQNIIQEYVGVTETNVLCNDVKAISKP
jgi:peroxiredoxin